MKGPGSFVTLTRMWWKCREPVPGDVLRTATGRRYVIIGVRRRKLDCIVLAPDEADPELARVFEWTWHSSGTRNTRPNVKRKRPRIGLLERRAS